MKNIFLPWAGTAFVTASGIAFFFRKNLAKILKVIKVSRDILDLVDEGVSSTADDKLTPEEVQKLTDLFVRLKNDLKGNTK